MIIGASGEVGRNIAASVAKGNNRLLLNGKNTSELSLLTEKLKKENPGKEIEAITCRYNGCWEADVIVLAVPSEEELEIAQKIREVANQKLVISISDPLNVSYNSPNTAPGNSQVNELQKWLPNSKVVKAPDSYFAIEYLNSN
jgi:predicted dinucleotide-binding enzyme